VEAIALRSAIAHGGRDWEADIIAAAHMLGDEQPKRKVNGSRAAGPTDTVDEQWRGYHQRFHDTLVAACGLTSLMNYRNTLISLNDRYRRLSSMVPSARDVAAEHRALTEAVLKRDADRAVVIVEEHFLETATRVLAGSSNFKGKLSETINKLRTDIRAGDGRWPGSGSAAADTPAKTRRPARK